MRKPFARARDAWEIFGDYHDAFGSLLQLRRQQRGRSYEDNNEDELWYDYAGKFYEVTSELEPTEGGIYPAYLDSYENELIFQGTNANGVRGMWVSNGTKAGTHRVTGIKNAYPGGLDPSLFKTYAGMVLFDGASSHLGSPVCGLWITKGTAGSTYELGGVDNREIKNANTTGGLLAYAQGFTLFNGAAYFDGYDAAGNIGLWRTNGTVAGTYEIQPIVGAFKVGSPGTDIQPDYMCVVGNEMFFGGADLQDAQYGLWVTNGMAGGTIEIGGQGNKGVKNSPYKNAMNPTVGIGPTDITAFDGKAMFAGTDNTVGLNGYYTDTVGLWESNGTAAGTTEIGGQAAPRSRTRKRRSTAACSAASQTPTSRSTKTRFCFWAWTTKANQARSNYGRRTAPSLAPGDRRNRQRRNQGPSPLQQRHEGSRLYGL